MKTHLGAGHHQGIAHIIACISHIGELQPFQAAELFLHGEQVSQHLGRMKLICQPVPYRNTGILRQFLNQFLAEAAVFYTVIHPAEDARSVRYALFLAHLRAAGVKIGHAHAKIHPGHFKGTACPRGGLFKEQHYVFPLQIAVRNAGTFECLEFFGQIQQITDLLRCIVKQCQKTSSANIDSHRGTVSFI